MIRNYLWVICKKIQFFFPAFGLAYSSTSADNKGNKQPLLKISGLHGIFWTATHKYLATVLPAVLDRSVWEIQVW